MFTGAAILERRYAVSARQEQKRLRTEQRAAEKSAIAEQRLRAKAELQAIRTLYAHAATPRHTLVSGDGSEREIACDVRRAEQFDEDRRRIKEEAQAELEHVKERLRTTGPLSSRCEGVPSRGIQSLTESLMTMGLLSPSPVMI